MKFTFKERHNTNENDCWNDALALATNQSYDKVRKDLKALINKNGSVDDGIIISYLRNREYEIYEFDITLYTAMQMIDTRQGVVFTLKHKTDKLGHIIYVKDNVIYDNIKEVETVAYYHDYKIEYICMKIENDYEYL